MMNKLKIVFVYVCYFLIDLFIFPSKNIKKKSLLIIRLDAIGDYVLFRNYIEILKKSEKYKDYSITLLGNNIWSSISEELDAKYIDKFIWISRSKFMENFRYRYNKLQKITSLGYEIVINPTYSRSFFIDDNIVKLISANKKIGAIGDLSNLKKWQSKISNRYYQTLIKNTDEIIFEFNRNKEFFVQLLEEEFNISNPSISLLQKQKVLNNLPANYAILFIGASASFRKWDIMKFIEIAHYLKEHYDYNIVLCGGPDEIEDSQRFKKLFNLQYINLVGKTSLLELITIISNASFLISNETSVPHFGVALKLKNIVVISNGNHYGRFTPYPKDVSKNYHVIYPPQITENITNPKKLNELYGKGSNLDIMDVAVVSVKQKIKSILSGEV